MPSKFNSTAKKPGKAVKKPYKRGGRAASDTEKAKDAHSRSSHKYFAGASQNPKRVGRTIKKAGGRTNLRDEEARVIGVQDNAADEMRRVKARRPKDAAERRDKKDQLARVGSRERNARDEMDRLRDEAGNMGMKRGGRSKKDAEKAQSKGTGNFDKYVRSRGWMREGNRPGSTSSGLKTGGKAVKKMATGRQTEADKADEHLGMADGRESTKRQSYADRRHEMTGEDNAMRRGMTHRSRNTSPSTKRQGNMLINQHKRMAMGQDVLLAKGGRTPSTTAVNIDMGAPKTKTIKARGMGAAIKGGQFRENT